MVSVVGECIVCKKDDLVLNEDGRCEKCWLDGK